MTMFSFYRCGFLAAGLVVAAVSITSARVPDQAKPAAAAPAGGIEPCALLTREDAAAAVGGAVGEGKPTVVNSAGHVAGSCAYDGSGLNHISLNMYLFGAGSAEVQVYRGLCAKKEQVTGIGDMACWYNDKHHEIQALKGGTVATIQITRSGDASEPLKAALKKVVDRLPAK